MTELTNEQRLRGLGQALNESPTIEDLKKHPLMKVDRDPRAMPRVARVKVEVQVTRTVEIEYHWDQADGALTEEILYDMLESGELDQIEWADFASEGYELHSEAKVRYLDVEIIEVSKDSE